MPQISKYPVREEIYERIFELLLKLLTDSYNKSEAKELIEDLLTPTERIVLAKRLGIVVLLAKNYDYRDIQDILHVSKESIAKVNIILKYGSKGYKNFVRKVFTEEKIEKFWEKMQDLLLATGSFGGKGSQGWRYLRKEVEAKRRKKETPI